MKYYLLGIFLLCSLCHAGPQRDTIDEDWYPGTESSKNNDVSQTTPAASGAPPSQDNPNTDSEKMKPKSSKGKENGDEDYSKFSSITVGDTESNSNSSTTYFHQSKNENTRSKWTHFAFPKKGGNGGGMGHFQPPPASPDSQSQPPAKSQTPVAPATQAPAKTSSGAPAASSPTPANGPAPNQRPSEQSKPSPPKASNPKENDNDSDHSGLSSITVGDTEGTSNSTITFFNDDKEENTKSKWTNFAFPQSPEDDSELSENKNGNGNGGGQGQAQGQEQRPSPPGPGQMNFPFAGGFPPNMFGHNFFGGGGPNGQNNFNG